MFNIFKYLPKKITQNIELGVEILNFNSLVAGFLGGLVCSTVLFVCSRAWLLHKLIKREKLQDLSYFGRNAPLKKRH